jgi:hypothetical protein
MKMMISFLFILAALFLVWYSPGHAIALGAVLSGMCLAAITMNLGDLKTAIQVIAIYYARLIKTKDATGALQQALYKYGLNKEPEGES